MASIRNLWTMVKTGADGLPNWANILIKVGIIPAISVYLVWFLTQKVQTSLEASQSTLNNIQTLMQAHINAQDDSYKLNRQTFEMLRVICMNGAKNHDERNECLK